MITARFRRSFIASCCLLSCLLSTSARQVPIATEVDVVVVGGSSGAVAAAVEASKAGAQVFLAAPRTYVGEDMAGTLQLWLEPGEKPATALAREVYNDIQAAYNRGIPFTYTANQPSQAPHKDTPRPHLLNREGPALSPEKDSVQYQNDVSITADLGSVQEVKAVEVTAFQRGTQFKAQSIQIETSEDAREWKKGAVFPCSDVGSISKTTIPLEHRFRYARLHVKRLPKAERLLLGRIRFLGIDPAQSNATSFAVRPMHVKKTLEQALIEAKVDYLYGCYATDLLVDGNGRPGGVVMANRAGRQAVVAKVIVDATENGNIARMAGAAFRDSKGGKQTFTWVTIAGQAASGKFSVKKLPFPVNLYNLTGDGPSSEKAYWFEYSLRMDVPDQTWPTRARLEQMIRDATYVASQQYAADMPSTIPPCSIQSKASPPESWPGAAQLDLNVLKPSQIENIWVLGGCADLARADAAKMLRPNSLMEVGARVGTAAAQQAHGLSKPASIKVKGEAQAYHVSDVEDREALDGLRPFPIARTVAEEDRVLPVLGSYDVVVAGGGTSGAGAGIGAARHGAKTLVIEYLHGLGGVGTLGMIGKYWYGNRVGFTATVPQNPTEVRMEFLRGELRKAGAEIWFGSMACGTRVSSNRVTGVIVATPFGRGVVLAKTVIDGSGNADLAAAAGAETRYVEDDFALQASHMPPRELGAYYINGDIPAVDVADPLDVRQALHLRQENYFDRGTLVDSRERRRIVGDYCLDWLDQINRRTFPDSIAYAQSDYDSHGYQIHPFFMLRPARPPGDYKHQFYSYVPYRCLLPRDLDNMLVVGLGLSAHRDALPIVRMQPDLQNIGYAAGVAAAMASKQGVSVRQIDVKALQKHLVEIGNLSASVLTDCDSLPWPEEKLTGAVNSLTNDYAGLEVLLTSPGEALPLLRKAFSQASGKDKLIYAHVLGIMGDATGVPVLLAEARRRLESGDFVNTRIATDKSTMDGVTRLIWALGRTKDPQVVPVLCAIAERTALQDFSRFRAVVVSLGRMANPAAAPTLAKLLDSKTNKGDVGELIAACALYRCGDRDGQAKRTLERFARGANGPFSRLATQVLLGAY